MTSHVLRFEEARQGEEAGEEVRKSSRCSREDGEDFVLSSFLQPVWHDGRATSDGTVQATRGVMRRAPSVPVFWASGRSRTGGVRDTGPLPVRRPRCDRTRSVTEPVAQGSHQQPAIRASLSRGWSLGGSSADSRIPSGKRREGAEEAETGEDAEGDSCRR